MAGVLLAAATGRPQTPRGDPPAGRGDTVVVLAAGDIANCERLAGAEATARLLDRLDGTILTLGDHAYTRGSRGEFARCYEPTWGRHKARTRPTPGNHDYLTDRGSPYFQYFGAQAGPDGRGYYSFDLGAWHVVSLNSNVPAHAGSAQVRWLRADLAAAPRDCILAYWHTPRFSSGPHGSDPFMREVWQVLYQAGADIVLNGHDHVYERLAPQDPQGRADPARGIRQFTVGTGGGGLYRFGRPVSNSEMRLNTTYGVLKLTLAPGQYAWEFVSVADERPRDAGSAACTPGPPPASRNPAD